MIIKYHYCLLKVRVIDFVTLQQLSDDIQVYNFNAEQYPKAPDVFNTANKNLRFFI